MRAMVQDRYGGPETLVLREVERPTPGEGELLLTVRATALNALDWHFLRGEPWFMRVSEGGIRRPRRTVHGVDVAGVVAAVGPGVTGFAPGDEVIAQADGGGMAEQVVVSADVVVAKPPNATFEEACTLGVAAVTALQAVRDHGRVGPGDRVLVHGASGGVGTFAVQIAKVLGAEVVAVCSTRNVEMVRGLGADEVRDYTVGDPLDEAGTFDCLVHVGGTRPLRDFDRVLRDDSRFVVVGSSHERSPRLMATFLGAATLGRFATPRRITFTASETAADLAVLADWVEQGLLRPVVERTYPLAEGRAAMAHLDDGHARAKVVVVP